MKLREAVRDDLPQLLDIYNWAIRSTTATFDLEEQTLEQRGAWFAHHDHAYPLVVAEEDGQVVGYSSLSRFRDKPAYAKTVESSVYIAPLYHGRGFGTRLMSDIIERAEAIGHHAIIAGIADGNESSVRLHVGLGFKHIGCFREVGFKFGAWRHVDFYEYLIE